MFLLLSSLLQYLEHCPFLLQILRDFYTSLLHISLNGFSNRTDFSGTIRWLFPIHLEHRRIAFLYICLSTFYRMYIIEVKKGKSCRGINLYKAMHLWNGVCPADYNLPMYALNTPSRLPSPATTSQLAEVTIREDNNHLLVPRLLWSHALPLCPLPQGTLHRGTDGSNLMPKCEESLPWENTLQILRVTI